MLPTVADATPLTEALDLAAMRRRLPEPELRRLIRRRAGVPLRVIADECGVTYEAARRWERGGRDPSGDHLRRYAAVLDRLAAEAMNGNGPVGTGPQNENTNDRTGQG